MLKSNLQSLLLRNNHRKSILNSLLNQKLSVETTNSYRKTLKIRITNSSTSGAAAQDSNKEKKIFESGPLNFYLFILYLFAINLSFILSAFKYRKQLRNVNLASYNICHHTFKYNDVPIMLRCRTGVLNLLMTHEKMIGR